MFLNSHNVNTNQNHSPNAATHRSRKEKLICRSIVTSEPTHSGGDASEAVDSNNHNHGPVFGEVQESEMTNNVNEFSQRLVSGSSTASQLLKLKSPRKSKLALPTSLPNTNGTAIYDTNGASISHPTAKLPKRMKIDCEGDGNGSNANGIITNSIKKSSSTKSKKPKKPKLDKDNKEKPKRKYTKRKHLEVHPILINDLNSIPIFNPNPNSISLKNYFSPDPNLPSFCDDNQWLHQLRYSSSTSSSPSTDSQSRHSSPKTPGDHDNCNSEQVSELRELRVPSSNTHLLLSPQTLKRMLRSPSPASQNCSLAFSEEELDEEIIQASNSLFKDMSLNRQHKAPSPTASSHTSSSTSTTSSATHGRGRYSRRKFGRLYPPFDPNHCCHPHCVESTLTGSKYCGSHVNGHLLKQTSSAVYGQCIYTDPLSLKPCKQTVYGEDDREFRFCDSHSARVAATRLLIHRKHQTELKDQSMEKLLSELQKCLVAEDEKPRPLSTATSTSTSSDEKSEIIPVLTNEDKEELSKEFLAEIDVSPPHYSKDLKCFSRFQPDNESDEDLEETDDHDPLKHAGYYSTNEVISIYRSKLEKLRSLYRTQFSVLKNGYMEVKHRCNQEKERNELRRFTYTCDPKYISIQNPDLPGGYKDEQLESRQKSLLLMRYHHRSGAKKIVQLQANKEYEKLKTEEMGKKRKAETDAFSSEHKSDEEYDIENPYQFQQAMSKMEAAKKRDKANVICNLTETGEQLIPNSVSNASVSTRLCAYGSDVSSTRCSSVPLPRSKFCKTHILNDPEQVLFSHCGQPLHDTKEFCENAIIRGLHKTGCALHRLALVNETKPTEEENNRMIEDFTGFSFADSDEEQEVLENLLAKETYSMNHFDQAVKYLDEKGYEAPDTDDSDSGDENEEEEEQFKALLEEELKEPELLTKCTINNS